MMRILGAVFLSLLLVVPASAGPNGIAGLTLEELHGPKIPTSFRDGVIAGVFLTVSASGGMKCAMMSAGMLKAGLEAALLAKEITDQWTVYHASLYVLARAGCTATDPAPVPMEKPNA